MKLLLCKKCHDVFNLQIGIVKQCSCGATKGVYTDNLNAWWSGQGIPLCIGNSSLREAMKQQRLEDTYNPTEFYGERFTAWVCPKNSETFVERMEE
jgi:hypothetical protein